MVTVFADDVLTFTQKKCHQAVVTAIEVTPERQLRLQINALNVCRREARIGRTPRMEAHVVDAIALAHLEVMAPFLD